MEKYPSIVWMRKGKLFNTYKGRKDFESLKTYVWSLSKTVMSLTTRDLDYYYDDFPEHENPWEFGPKVKAKNVKTTKAEIIEKEEIQEIEVVLQKPEIADQPENETPELMKNEETKRKSEDKESTDDEKNSSEDDEKSSSSDDKEDNDASEENEEEGESKVKSNSFLKILTAFTPRR